MCVEENPIVFSRGIMLACQNKLQPNCLHDSEPIIRLLFLYKYDIAIINRMNLCWTGTKWSSK